MSLNPKINDWHRKRIWIIGASSGIGHALAQQLLKNGALVAISARNADSLNELASGYRDQSLALPLDATDEAGWKTAYAAITTHWQGLDLFVYCAADYQPVRAWELDSQNAGKMVEVNLMGAIRGVATVLPDMLQNKQGSISMIASVAGYMGLPKSLIYGPTKAAMINFAEGLYLDLHDKGIGVSVINPGFVDTPLTKTNDFAMPALLTPDAAAAEIISGLEKGEFEIHFPKRFTRWLRFARQLPYPIRFRILAEVAKKS